MLRPVQLVCQALLSAVTPRTILHIKQERFLDLAVGCLCLPGQAFSGLRLWVHPGLYGYRLLMPLFPGATPEEGTP